jgi:hypothetical protein
VLRDGGSVVLEPEEVGAIVQALRAEARALLALGGESAIRGLALRELQHAVDALLQDVGTDTSYVLQLSERRQPKPDPRRHGDP